MSTGADSQAGTNPLQDGPDGWEQVIEAVGPAAMLVRIESRMGDALKRSLAAEDIWQETLLHAWRDRERHEWRGLPSFRRWLLEIAENRIRDTVDREGTLKRAGGLTQVSALARADADGSTPSSFAGAFSSTTPSRHVAHREQADLMKRALEALAPGLREVVSRRLFEEQGLDEIAAAMELSHAAVKHRLRKGSTLYRERLQALLGSRASAIVEKP